jgi:SAM-dependent methyltransferase
VNRKVSDGARAATYADITFADPNPVKRWLQYGRLYTAEKLIHDVPATAQICDFGAGNGELVRLLRARGNTAPMTCYEPGASRLQQARENLAHLSNIDFVSRFSEIENCRFDVVFCLEVLEHLPEREFLSVVTQIASILKPGGRAIIGLPVEVGPAALYKGIFRMSRRFGAFDASPANVIKSVFGVPPKQRPTKEIAPDMHYHPYHTGFDHRRARAILKAHFSRLQTTHSPFPILGVLCPEIYFVTTK